MLNGENFVKTKGEVGGKCGLLGMAKHGRRDKAINRPIDGRMTVQLPAVRGHVVHCARAGAAMLRIVHNHAA